MSCIVYNGIKTKCRWRSVFEVMYFLLCDITYFCLINWIYEKKNGVVFCDKEYVQPENKIFFLALLLLGAHYPQVDHLNVQSYYCTHILSISPLNVYLIIKRKERKKNIIPFSLLFAIKLFYIHKKNEKSTID